MKRTKIAELIRWKNSPNRKPLLLRGARQVGKTWLMKEFGKQHYEHTVYINFEKQKHLRALFFNDFDVDRIITAFQAETGLVIRPENTLLIFDEIQDAPEAISSLKYFYEDYPQYHIIAAGSLLGVALHSHISFPVGKIEFSDLYPLSFIEFLDALSENALINMLENLDWELISIFKNKFIERLKQYYFVGGMPEAVLQFRVDNNFADARKIHNQILMAYEQDFSKHAPNEIVPRIRMLWNSIPAQLAKENRKFIYGIIKEGARAKDYELALTWLIDCGLVYKICRITKPALPLKAYEDRSAFKLFIVDTGLLSALGNIDSKTIVSGNDIFCEFKGSLTEQYVLQQLICTDDLVVNYWAAERGMAEVDFVVQTQGDIFPIEVKAEENLQAKSLKIYNEKFKPRISIRTSMSDFRKQDWLINLPLYAISKLKKTVAS